MELVKAGLPAGPIAPAPLQTLRLLRDPYGFLLDCHARYGDWFTVRMIPCGTMIYVADPDIVRELFAQPQLRSGAVNAYMTPLLGDGLLTLDGDVHAAHRAILTPLFASDHASVIADESRRAIAGWPTGEFALRPHLDQLALRAMRRILFGDLAAELEPMLAKLKRRTLVEAAASLAATKLGVPTRSAKLVSRIDREVMAAIATRRATPGTGVLGALVRSELPDRAIRDELLTLLFAGHETVATTLAWVFERVTRHPDVLARLPDADDTYLDAVLHETMRQRSCLPDVGRILDAPASLGGWRLPAGAQVFPAIVPIHMRPDRYPEPTAFRPERFLDAAPEPWAFLPFGGGARRCIGAALAMRAMREIVRQIVRRRPAATTREPERGVGNGVTIGPHRGAVVRLERA